MERTIVVIFGNARGGEIVWESMYKNLLDPFNADLALCFGYSEDKSASLYSKAKYVWEIPEYKDWKQYFEEHTDVEDWKITLAQNTSVRSNTFLNVGDDNRTGTGLMHHAFKHYLHKYKKDILTSYDRIIITRSDYFYVSKHPILSNDYFWYPEGEEYGGITDRHHIFPSSHIDDVLGIFDNYINCSLLIEDFWYETHRMNSERIFYKYFLRTGYIKKVNKFPRVQICVKRKEDLTTWSEGDYTFPADRSLTMKYGEECRHAWECVLYYMDNRYGKDETERLLKEWSKVSSSINPSDGKNHSPCRKAGLQKYKWTL